MRNLVVASLLLFLADSLLLGADKPAPKTHEVRLNGHVFTLPAGFEIELAAGASLIDRPIMADFDEQGRLYVADSAGSNDPVAQQLQKKPHRILRLEDSDGDGRFDKRTVYADKMMFPEGVMWFAGSLYVSGAPSIWKLTDTNGDGVANQRVEWFQGKTLTGCANDLHGPYLGPDGWIYWCKGAFAKQTYERPGKPPFVTSAAHIFRCRPDGSGIEPVMTGGMDNPVEVAFMPGGERIFTTTFFQHPGGGRRDGLVHAIYGGVYGKDHEVIYKHPWTGPTVMPVLTHLGPAAPAGLTRYESDYFGPEYRNNLFATLFNMHKVTRHILEPHGASYKSRDEDFLLSNKLDFHPTDVLEDADGSLLVIDTGGWYKICCPTSQLHKPDILGAIYRIRRHGAPRVADPRGLKLAWGTMTATELAKLLGDPRPAVRRRAIQMLAGKGHEAVAALDQILGSNESTEARLNAVWTATRITEAPARNLVRKALDDTDAIVRQAALHSVSVWRDHEALPALLSMLENKSAHNRRAAAEALGRLGDKAAVPALLDAVGQSADRTLEHSLTFALIEIGDREATAAGLQSRNVSTRRAALTAIDQMHGGRLQAQAVAQELASSNPQMKETAWWIAGRHPEWGQALAGFLQQRLVQNLKPDERNELIRQLARFAGTPAIQKLMAARLADAGSSEDVRKVVLRAMAQAGLKEAPDLWIDGLTQLLADEDKILGEATTTARALHISSPRSAKLVNNLHGIAINPKLDVGIRLNALEAIPGGLEKVDRVLFTFLREQLNGELPVPIRSMAADVLARAKLDSDQLLELAEVLKSAGPMEVDRLVDAFAQSRDDKVGQHLIAALKVCKARAALRAASLQPRLVKFGPPVQRQAQELFALLNADDAKQKARLERMLGKLESGDVRRGQAIFNNTKVACSSCHAIGYLGGDIGPDLTHVGKIRSDRDLLESIVFPSVSIVRSYEPVVVATKAGKLYNGLIRKDTPDELVLALSANQEVRIPRDDIDEIQPSKVSIMPAGLDQQLTPAQLADLVAFLRACK